MKKKIKDYSRFKTPIFCLLFFCALFNSYADSSLNSVEAPLLRALELEGKLERPFLNYRSSNDEDWDSEVLESEVPGISSDLYFSTENVSAELYPAETFLSYNTAYPYGANDGSLWQGVGLNNSSSIGGNISTKGFSITLRPNLIFSQNRDFEILDSAYPDSGGFGYFWSVGLDEYQRPGDSYIADWSWGDSEIRYTWKAFTTGFGTQSVWLGPGVNNSLILTNNAAPFPKFDIGIHKTPIKNWGEFEFRVFWGKLSESSWFDKDSENDNNLFSVASASWSPSFFPELTLGLHRTILSKWNDRTMSAYSEIIIPDLESTGEDQSDQRFSLSGEMLFTEVGFRVWSEIAYNDFYRNWDTFVRYPFHTFAYNLGSEKVWRLKNPDYSLMIQAEMSATESSRDTAIYWPQTFYAHHIVTQGYTNEGQSLGASYGSGGTYQNIKATFIHPRGYVSAYLERSNVNNDYIYFLNSVSGIAVQSNEKDRYRLKAQFTAGAESALVLQEGMILSAGMAMNSIHNPLFNDDDRQGSDVLNSFYLFMGLKLKL